MDIPIIIICYNNYLYVKNTLEQILTINEEYYKNIQILNNKSTCEDTINFLNSVNVTVIHNDSNSGPWISPYNNKHVYDVLPDKFILTDPDLQLNENIPGNFIEILSNLSDTYDTHRIGFALSIDDFEEFYQGPYTLGLSIYDWEKKFWECKINNEEYELYYADIDTTFCLINKKNVDNHNCSIRIAGNFTAKHLPWYINNKIYNNIYQVYVENNRQTKLSTITSLINSYVDNNYFKIYKNNELFLFENNECNPNISFWKGHYNEWENETFEIFDKYLSKDKVFIDIGGWIGTTAMYGSRKSKHVYSIEADNSSIIDMLINLKTNCENNYTLINNAIYNIDDVEVRFGRNLHIENSKMNDSTSHIYNDDIIRDESYLIKTITLKSILEKYTIDVSDISLIKVDIEGGEELILNDLFDIHHNYGVPFYISLHYSWWKDKNLNRFSFLSSEIKTKIISNPFISILLE